jgi:hypothetical protein
VRRRSGDAHAPPFLHPTETELLMIITRHDDTLLMVEQHEHGRLAGEMAAHWGGGDFAPPEPRGLMVEAARRHDEAWIEPDATPLFNAEKARPQNFTETAVEEHMPLYERGVRAVQDSNPYAGLLVSMHWTGLYRERWGMQSGNTLQLRNAEESPQNAVITGEELRWIEAKRDLWFEHGTRAEFEANLWHNYELLQVLDLFSLYVSLSDLRTPSGGGEPADVSAVLAEMRPASGPRIIRAVPTRPVGQRRDITLRVAEPGVVTVDPFPFDGPLSCRLAAHRIADRTYDDVHDARGALDDAEQATIECELVPVG